jgi:hypothetical protein
MAREVMSSSESTPASSRQRTPSTAATSVRSSRPKAVTSSGRKGNRQVIPDSEEEPNELDESDEDVKPAAKKVKAETR